MKGDFSRISFDPKNHFSQVLLQQGRVTLDADPNEQSAILLHYLRTLAVDILGACAGPADRLGFVLQKPDDKSQTPVLAFSAGRYYVDGILVENDGAVTDYAQQFPKPEAGDAVLQLLANKKGDDVWLFLDVWERHVSAIEHASIREPGLGGPDTCSRAQVVWRVRGIARGALLDQLQGAEDHIDALLKTIDAQEQKRIADLQSRKAGLEAARLKLASEDDAQRYDCAAPLGALVRSSDGRMAARLDPGLQIKDACVLSPDAQYRGVENQLYRVEVHRAGGTDGTPATFKWSRDNGSVAAAWLSTGQNELVVASSRGFDAGVWVELTDDSDDLLGRPGRMVRLVSADGGRLGVDPGLAESVGIALPVNAANPKVRRWDQAETDAIDLVDGAVSVVAATGLDGWIDLEDGIQVRFEPGGLFRSGDYWLIPARVVTGSIDWPRDGQGTAAAWLPQPPRGIEHHYASLGYLAALGDNAFGVNSCVCTISPPTDCAPAKKVRTVKPPK